MAGLFGVCLWHIGTGVIADDPRGCCGRGRVVASDVFPVSLPAAGGATGLAVRAEEFFQMRMPGHAPYAGSGRPAGPVCR